MAIRNPQDVSRTPAEQYLEEERAAQEKHEYRDGEIVAMSGASREHNLIVTNAIYLLESQLRSGPCAVYPSDLRVHIPASNVYTYPDVVVTCGEEQYLDSHVDTLLNPLLLIEVLSDSTEQYDRGQKFLYYQQIPSLREYLLVAQTPHTVEQYTRQSAHLWSYRAWTDAEEQLPLHTLDATLSLRDLYARVA